MDANRNVEWYNTAAEHVALEDAVAAKMTMGQIDRDIPTVAERIAAGENLTALEDELDWRENQ